jgi:hypothetical protein
MPSRRKVSDIRLEPNVTYFATGKSSIAELPLNLTWNIYAFSGSFRRKERAFRMTARFKGRN